MAYGNNEPYNDLPLLPPSAEIETTQVLRRCISASRALAELKGAGKLIPNQNILINAIPLQEARLSSEIENIVTTQDALYRAIANDVGLSDQQTREVLRYRTALRHGYEAVQHRPISIELMLELCQKLLDKPVALRDDEHIIIEETGSNSVVYTPPRGRAVIVALLENLGRFLADTNGIDPPIKMAIAHYQFEAIHPFIDGNGRTGRILNLLIMLKANLFEIPVLYLSRYIIQNKAEYYRRLRAVTEKRDWVGWVLFMLIAVEETANWTVNRIAAIHTLLEETLARCRSELPGHIYSKELVELIFTQPYLKIDNVVDAKLAKRQTASVYLREMAKLGILVPETKGRTILYMHPALLKLLSE